MRFLCGLGGLVIGAILFFPLGIMYAIEGASNSQVVFALSKVKNAIITIMEVL